MNRTVCNAGADPSNPIHMSLASLIYSAFFLALPWHSTAPTAIAAALALVGVARIARTKDIDQIDLRFAALMLILPIAYSINMAVTGWDLGELSRPLRLVWAIPIFCVIRRINITVEILLIPIAVAAMMLMIFGLYQTQINGFDRAQAAFPNAGAFGNYTSVFSVILLTYVLYGSNASRRSKGIATTAFVACWVCMVISGTRSAWLAAIIVTPIALLAFPAPRRWSARALTLTIVAIAVAAILSISLETIRGRVTLAYDEITNYITNPDSDAAKNTAIGLRLASYKWGIERFRENPIFGIGIANFKHATEQAAKAAEIPTQISRFKGLHNLIVDHLAKTGVTGLIAVAIFWIWIVHLFWIQLRHPDTGQTRLFASFGLTLCLSEFIFSNVGSMFATSLGTTLWSLLLATFCAAASPKVNAGASDASEGRSSGLGTPQ